MATTVDETDKAVHVFVNQPTEIKTLKQTYFFKQSERIKGLVQNF